MPASSTIIIARHDFSIPGAAVDEHGQNGNAVNPEELFFGLLQANRPDVIVLDLSDGGEAGIATIRTIRERCGVPILVVHRPEDARVPDYRTCGAADCVGAPVDILVLNRAIQHIIKLTRPSTPGAARAHQALAFAGVVFRPDQNTLQGPQGERARLTTLENDVLSHLAARPRTVCSRADIARKLYGSRPPTTDRAIDVIVNRLRKKLTSVGGPPGDSLVRTEFRRGYIFGVDVSIVSH